MVMTVSECSPPGQGEVETGLSQSGAGEHGKGEAEKELPILHGCLPNSFAPRRHLRRMVCRAFFPVNILLFESS